MGNVAKKIKSYFNYVNPWADDWGEDWSEGIADEDALEENIVEDIKPFRLVARKDLNLQKPRWRRRLKTPVEAYFLRYFTNTPECTGDEECGELIRKLQITHKNLGLPDIAYNFMIGNDGTVYEGRGWQTKPCKLDWQAMKYHGKTIDIGFIGDYKDIHPPDEMTNAANSLMRTGVGLGMAEEGYEVYDQRDDIPTGEYDREAMEEDIDEKIYDDCEPEPDTPNT